MNIRFRDRFALAAYSLIIMAASASAVAYELIARSFAMDTRMYITCGATLVAFILGVCTLKMAFRHKNRKDRNSVTVQNKEHGNGEVRVSVQALDALVKQAVVGHTDGVCDIKTRIVNHDDSISVKIDMSLNGDVHIPNITMLLQGTIKAFIEEFSGIAVRDVSIMVNTIVPVMPQLSLEAAPVQPAVVIEEPKLVQEAAQEPVIEEAEEQEAAMEPDLSDTAAAPADDAAADAAQEIPETEEEASEASDATDSE